ncbi:MAG: DEAD/DEAH box helicase [Blastocatellia bacterium]|nr:DEAD/DEAH box helicase [Blastocatellia bacterium]
MTFDSFQLHPHVLAGVKSLGYLTPTPIQHQSIPAILAGSDVLGLAQTGTGKTAAFVLPILHRLSQGPRGLIRALILAPTRELAEQIHTTIGGLGRTTGIRSTTVYGGVGMQPQVAKLRRNTEIVVACPGRLLDHLGQGTIDLSRLEVLVLDEADMMFDMGFLVSINKILDRLPKKRQNLLFSATMPDQVKGLATKILQHPITVQVGKPAPAATVSHALFPVGSDQKTTLLNQLLQGSGKGSVLVFTKTKHRAKRLAEQLQKMGHGTASLQGNLSQNKRQEALEGFRTGRHRILVATDIAARGIDVSGVSHVINYDMPDTVEAYTHRIGRTGRADHLGDAFTLVTSTDEPMVKTIERTLGKKIERRTIEGFTYVAPETAGDRDFIRAARQSARGGWRR